MKPLSEEWLPRALPAGPVLLLIALFYGFGILFHLLPATRDYMPMLTPYVLYGLGAVVLYPVLRERRREVLLWAAATFLLTFTLEAVGVATGLIFGTYRYGEVLGARIAGVPPVIGFNWVLVLLGCLRGMQRLTASPAVTALLTGAAAVIFDLVLEPVAVGLGYWSWQGGTIPLQNYGAWFLIAAAAGWAYRKGGLQLSSTIPAGYVMIQFAFFIGLRVSGAV
jgi:putative membrane protein